MSELAKKSFYEYDILTKIIISNLEKFQEMINNPLFPRHHLGSKPEYGFPFKELCDRLRKELSGEIPSQKWILLGTQGWKVIRRMVGRKAKHWQARGGTIVGNSRQLGNQDSD